MFIPLLGLLSAAVAPAASAPAHSTSVFVVPLTAAAPELSVAQQATTAVAQALIRRDGYAVLTVEDAQQLASVEATKQLLGCKEDAGCVARLSQAVKADLVITGSLGRVGRTFTVGLALIDAKGSAVRNRISTAADSEREVVESIPKLVARLMGWTVDQAAVRFQLPKGVPTSFAVLDLTPLGVPDQVAANLTQVLSAEIKRVDGTSVISREDIRAMLQVQETRLRVGCDDMACLAEMGGALGVEKLVTGSVGRLGGRYVVSLRLISTRLSRVENLVSEAYRGAEDQLIRAVRRAGRELLGVVADQPGALAISGSEPGAQVFMDGHSAGRLPMPPVQNLPGGLHALQLSKSGYLDWQGDVYVEPGDTAGVWVELTPRPLRWYQQWWVWTLLGGLGVGSTALLLTVAGVAVSSVVLTAVLANNQRGTSDATVTVEGGQP